MKNIIKNLIVHVIKGARSAVLMFLRPGSYSMNSVAIFLASNIAFASIGPVAIQSAPVAIAEVSMEAAIANTSIMSESRIKPIKPSVEVTITGYSSTPDQTDDTPFTTASGEHVRYGIVAANFLPFNTLVKIPRLFGDKIFIVKDRMAKRFSDRMDIWFVDRADALKFGIRKAEIVVL